MTVLLQVALGGAIGAAMRFLANGAALRVFGAGFPWGTLMVNAAGSLLIGIVVASLEARGLMRLAPLLVTGVLGGFTTFSAFSLETVTLIGRGQGVLALLYVGASVLLCLSAAAAGLGIARAVA